MMEIVGPVINVVRYFSGVEDAVIVFSHEIGIV
jgi:hypothetical protein